MELFSGPSRSRFCGGMTGKPEVILKSLQTCKPDKQLEAKSNRHYLDTVAEIITKLYSGNVLKYLK